MGPGPRMPSGTGGYKVMGYFGVGVGGVDILYRMVDLSKGVPKGITIWRYDLRGA